MTTTVQLPRETRAAEVRPHSFDVATNTIEIVWTTGAAVRRYDRATGQAYDEVLEVSPRSVRLGRLNAGAPFLNTHASYELGDVLGSVVPGSAQIEAGRGVATILLSRAASDADIVQKIRDGVIRNISAGYIRHQIEKSEAESGQVATWRVTDWEPIEISAVPIPADPGAQTRSGSAETFPCLVRTSKRSARRPSLVEVTRARMIARAEASDPIAAARARMIARRHALGA